MEFERPRVLPFLIVAGLFLVIAGVALNAGIAAPAGFEGAVTPLLGLALMTEYVAAFEIVAVLLVAALVGGVYLAKRAPEEHEAVERAVDMKPQVDAREAEETMGVRDDGSD